MFAYATALTLVPASIATLVLGSGDAPPARIASAIGWICLIWLGVIAHRAIRCTTGQREKSIRILVIAVVLFYIVPLVFIVAAVSIIIAAILLEYF